MKNGIILALTLLVAATACHKSDSHKVTATSSLIGSWQWAKTSGGIAGITETPASTGKHLKYTFNSDSSCVIVSDTSTVTTRFSVYTDSTFYYPGHLTQFLTFANMPAEQFVMTITNDTLSFNNEYVDGFNHICVKM